MDTRSTICCKVLYPYWRYACLLLLAPCLSLWFGRAAVTQAQGASSSAGKSSHIVEIRSLYPNTTPIYQLSGLTYADAFNQFYLIEQDATQRQVKIMTLSPYEDLLATTTLTALDNTNLNLIFDADGQQLLLFSRDNGDALQLKLDQQGAPDANHQLRSTFKPIAVNNTQGLTLASPSQPLFILDHKAQQIVQVAGNATNRFTAAAGRLDLAPFGQSDLRGVAFHPQDQHLYLLNMSDQSLYKLTTAGQVVTVYDLAPLHLVDPQGLVFAPSSDRTDAAATMHLFIADAGTPDQKREGRIVEVALDPPGALTSAATTTSLSLFLVRNVDLSQKVPPSPDPSGITYLPASNHLLISDGEVDEITDLFTGNNLYEMTLTGDLTRVATTLPYSFEPTGVDDNPANGHVFISDDDRKRVFELAAGPDNRFGTGDDVITSFSTSSFESYDPEGLAFNHLTGELYIIDGINNEVYTVNPGANGRFDGIPGSGGDDVVTHFDILGLGILDPEAGHYDSATGHLIIAGRSDEDIYEVTTDGLLARILTIADINTEKLAGVTMAPGSRNPSVMNYYVVDRGVDNDVDSAENDGKLYEFTLVPAFGDLLISPRNNGVVGGVAYKDEDILSYNNSTDEWALYFDGSDVGITTDVDAFAQLDDGALLLSFEIDTPVSGLGIVDDSDIVRFTPEFLGATTSGAFSWYFDGSDVELTTDSEDIDAFAVVSGTLRISTLGDPTVTGLTGLRDEDLLTFTPTQLGETTSGLWAFYFDGSDVGLGETDEEDIQGAYIDPASGAIYVSTKGPFSVPGLTGDGADISICTPVTLGANTSCTYTTFWDGSSHGLRTETIDAFGLNSLRSSQNTLPPGTISEPVDETPEPPTDNEEEGPEPDEGTADHYLFLPLIRD